MSKEPICFGCEHFKQYQPRHFRTPGVCKWHPREEVPAWLQFFLDRDARYYGPQRDVSTMHPILHCAAFEALVISEEVEYVRERPSERSGITGGDTGDREVSPGPRSEPRERPGIRRGAWTSLSHEGDVTID